MKSPQTEWRREGDPGAPGSTSQVVRSAEKFSRPGHVMRTMVDRPYSGMGQKVSKSAQQGSTRTLTDTAVRFTYADASRIASDVIRNDAAHLVLIDLSRSTDATTAAFARLLLLRRQLLGGGVICVLWVCPAARLPFTKWPGFRRPSLRRGKRGGEGREKREERGEKRNARRRHRITTLFRYGSGRSGGAELVNHPRLWTPPIRKDTTRAGTAGHSDV